MQKTLERMRAMGFEVVEVDTREQVREYLLQDIPADSTVGVSGSVSVRETGVMEAMTKRGQTVYSHWYVKPEDVEPMRVKACGADVYLTSANALTKHGELILIDGAGNRVSAVAYGPKRVYFIVSHSKWVDGGYGAAVARIKRIACPPNARRQEKELPCAINNECDPESCTADSMCRMTLSVNRAPRSRKMTLVFVKENLGY
ncbi:MAG TPA: lactate utilization protein [Candidatus Limiplasma sp.]|mgnify:CR=1 FL=1|nr:lactate utilization protein [Candidatus Limiplasma sp.]HRX08318.1 lactate utilization protein [Candidatus Limiplasma sp.]